MATEDIVFYSTNNLQNIFHITHLSSIVGTTAHIYIYICRSSLSALFTVKL